MMPESIHTSVIACSNLYTVTGDIESGPNDLTALVQAMTLEEAVERYRTGVVADNTDIELCDVIVTSASLRDRCVWLIPFSQAETAKIKEEPG